MASQIRTVMWIQGLFYVATGLWPIVHLASFQRITGPKTDTWLVRTLGGLICAVGASLIAQACAPQARRNSAVLGLGSAIALGTADVVYARSGRISKIYLLDAAAEAAIMGGWIEALGWRKRATSVSMAG
jgi:hypothetical protein